MATLLKADGTSQEVAPKNGQTWTLEELQEFVGGFIEIIHPQRTMMGSGRKMVLIVDEEGLLKKKSYNVAASMYANGNVGGPSCIVGDVLYCLDKEIP